MTEPAIVLRPENAFFDLFSNGLAPVQSAFPSKVMLAGLGENFAYLLDGERITTRQMQDVAFRFAELRNARVRDVLDELLAHGLPIRVSEVAVPPAAEMHLIPSLPSC